jgi:tetratricopeptide (TPR) repeat protein
MQRKFTVFLALVGAATLLLVGAGCQKLRARDNLNKGVQAYRSARYGEAVEFFKQAVAIDPAYTNARLYLATAYMSQYIPGADSPENVQMANAAHDEFMKVIELDPRNSIAIASIASLFFNQKKFDEAREWHQKLIAVDPKAKESYYTLGVIAWTRSFQKRMEARAKLGMKPEDPGPLKDKKVREAVRSEILPMIEDGIKNLDKALELDKEYDDAMAYLNLLHRDRADVAETKEEYEKDTDAADRWVEKTLETKKIKAARTPAAGIVQEEEKK